MSDKAHSSGSDQGQGRTRRYPTRSRTNLFDLIPYFILAAVILAIIVINPRLANAQVLETKTNAALVLILAAIGETFVILTAGIDLSIGGIISLTNSLAATRMTDDPGSIIFWILVIVLIGALAGSVNGFIVTKMGINPFIATLATWSLWQGIALLVLESDGGAVSPTLKTVVRAKVLGIPGSLIILIVLFLAWAWFRRTRWSLQIYAVGSNERGVALSGVNTTRVKITAYALSGLFAALAGLYRTVQVGSGSPVAGNGLILPAVAATVLGGTSLFGGRGGVHLSIIGALIMLFLNDLIFFAGIETFWTPLFQGLLMILAVAVNSIGNRRSQQRALA